MLNESDRAFFRPKWRRIAATLFCVGWAILEWVSGNSLWGTFAVGITFYCLWNFFYQFDESDTPNE